MIYDALTILMADDDLEDMEMMEDVITAIEPKAVLHKVDSGKAAIDYLNSQPGSKLPCLIILDYNMPELKGSEVLEVIRKDNRYKGIPKVILSTSNTKAYIEECIRHGATEYFVKPHNLDDLTKIAKQMLNYCKSDNQN